MFNEVEYDKRIAALFERHQSVQAVGFKSDSYKPGLDGMRRFDAVLGYPSSGFRSIHVAGTNGKGSTCSMLAASLAASGLKVGLYTSPHLLDFRERVRLVGPDGTSMIPREDVWDFLEKYSSEMESLSFFEITTGLAFWWFSRQEVDVAVIETGLGGRLDSTNIITPEVSVVTSIGLDHCAILGNTRELIAGEKAGIFKPGVPAVVGTWDDETGPVFERVAAEVHCPLFFADSGTDNVGTVLTTLDILGEDPDMEAIADFKARTAFRGRWETLCDNPETICDIGHNPAALDLNFNRLLQSGKPLIIVYGVMADKDLDGIAPLMPAEAQYVLVAPATSRSLPVDRLKERLSALRPDLHATAASSVAEGVDMAFEKASSMPGSMIYIGGSTFVVSEAIAHIQK